MTGHFLAVFLGVGQCWNNQPGGRDLDICISPRNMSEISPSDAIMSARIVVYFPSLKAAGAYVDCKLNRVHAEWKQMREAKRQLKLNFNISFAHWLWPMHRMRVVARGSNSCPSISLTSMMHVST